MSHQDTIQVTVTDSNGDVEQLAPVEVVVYAAPTATIAGLPASAAAGAALAGTITATVDPALTIRTVTATLNGAELVLTAGATPETYTFTFTA